jgi:hypothetical protein
MRGFDAWGLHVFLNYDGDFAAANLDATVQRFGQRATSARGGLRLRAGSQHGGLKLRRDRP